MTRAVKFTEEGKKTLHSLHIDNQREVKNRLKELANDLSIGKALTGRLQGLYSLRVGKYRAIFSLDGELIIVHVVGHRRDIYKKLDQMNKQWKNGKYFN